MFVTSSLPFEIICYIFTPCIFERVMFFFFLWREGWFYAIFQTNFPEKYVPLKVMLVYNTQHWSVPSKSYVEIKWVAFPFHLPPIMLFKSWLSITYIRSQSYFTLSLLVVIATRSWFNWIHSLTLTLLIHVVNNKCKSLRAQSAKTINKQTWWTLHRSSRQGMCVLIEKSPLVISSLSWTL